MNIESIEEKARKIVEGKNGLGARTNEFLVAEVASFATKIVKEARREFDKELAGEMRDPNGTIWECYRDSQKEISDLKAQLEVCKHALWAAVDVIPRWTKERIANPQGVQQRCVFCKGHDGGELGVSHTEHCIVGRAMKLCKESLSVIGQEVK